METEVTNAQYSSFITAGGYTEKSFWSEEGWLWLLSQNVVQPAYWNDKLFSEDNQPVVGINWHEATAYANWLSGETNLIIRLPTEEEWEKAARGSAGLIFPWGNEWDGQHLNYQSDDNHSYSAPVGSYSMGTSPYGVLDMAGNVWEWTSSRYQERVGNTAEKIVLRGGSSDNKPVFTRTSVRGTFNPDARPNTFGLRVVLIDKP